MKRTLRGVALDLLSRREHSTRELQDKLLSRDFELDEIRPVLQTLSREGLLSDERFVESFIHSRMGRGSGPVKIRLELRQRGISDELIETWLDERDERWNASAEAVRVKKFGSALPTEYRERARQTRFLQYRGFTPEQIRRVLQDDEF